ncbi:MAG: acyltransferase [Frankiaceae bacterium]|nr:acyltransferase [Frankiaceae bacterium]
MLAVVGYHTNLRPFRGGDLGVQVFFVLSGFLITSLLLGERERAGRLDLKAFYLRRVLRLAPALVVVLAVVLLVGELRLGRIGRDFSAGAVRTQVLLAATYFSDVAAAAGYDMGPLLHTWTLSIEEHFYLLWPPLLVLLSRRRPQVIVWFVLAGALLSWLLRSILVLHGASLVRTTYGPDVRADGLLLGCALAAWLVQHDGRCPPRLARLAPGWVGLAVLAVLVVFPPPNRGGALFGYALGAVASALLIVGVLPGASPRLATWVSFRPLVHVGVVSYGLYLWNFVLVRMIAADDVPAVLGPAVGPARLLLCFAAAELSYRLVEAPFLRLKQRAARGALPAAT